MDRGRVFGAMFVAAMLTSGCSAVTRLPLCPAIAANSYDSPDKLQFVNSYIARWAQERDIHITMLSPFVAAFEGAQFQLDELRENYRFMLCAFNPLLEVDDRSTYLSCMSHANQWVDIVRSASPENLLLVQTKYKENCVTSPYGGLARRT